MLATQLNHMVDSKELDKNVVVKLNGFVTNAVQGRKCVSLHLCLDCRPMTHEVTDQIDYHPRT
jgi:hypothetical protein